MIRQLVDILATLMEAGLLYYVMSKDIKREFKKLLPTITLHFFPVLFMTHLNMAPEEKFLWVIFLFSLIGVLVFGLKITYSIVLGSLLYLCIGLGEIIVQVGILFFADQSVTVFIQNIVFFALAVFLSKLLAGIFTFWFKKLFSGLDQAIDFKFSVILIVPILLFIYIETKLIGLILGYTDNSIVHDEIMFSFFIIITSICMIFSIRYMLVMKSLQISQNMNEEQLRLIYQYYKMRREHDEEIKKIYHDLNTHLSVIEKYENEEERKNYVGRLKKELKKVPSVTCSGNEIIDIVLNDKREKYRDIQFLLLIQGNVDTIKEIDEMDLVTILGNALENAAEAVMKQEPDIRVVQIHIKIVHKFVIFKIENEYTGACPEPVKTSKENAFLHGYGIINIREAADKYDGYVEINTANHKFSLQIILSL